MLLPGLNADQFLVVGEGEVLGEDTLEVPGVLPRSLRGRISYPDPRSRAWLKGQILEKNFEIDRDYYGFNLNLRSQSRNKGGLASSSATH
eukprot:3622508-Rhodomonas_salina.1